MPLYSIEIPSLEDDKFRVMFPEGPEELFKRVVADAVQAYDQQDAEAQKPQVVRMDTSLISVKAEALPMEKPLPVLGEPIVIDMKPVSDIVIK